MAPELADDLATAPSRAEDWIDSKIVDLLLKPLLGEDSGASSESGLPTEFLTKTRR